MPCGLTDAELEIPNYSRRARRKVNLLEIYAGKILAERMGDENKAVGNKMLW